MCDAKKALLIIDEIQAGTGRTGTFLASQQSGVEADIVCLGKGLAAGIPVGATVVRSAIAAAIPKHIHTSTFGGNPLACAGVMATLTFLDGSRLQEVQRLGRIFKDRLASIQSPLIREVRGQGLMIGVTVTEKRNQLLKALQDRRVVAIPAGEDVVRFLPPFVITEAEIEQAAQALEESLRILA